MSRGSFISRCKRLCGRVTRLCINMQMVFEDNGFRKKLANITNRKLLVVTVTPIVLDAQHRTSVHSMFITVNIKGNRRTERKKINHTHSNTILIKKLSAFVGQTMILIQKPQ